LSIYKTKCFGSAFFFPSSGGVDIKIFVLWWTSDWKYRGLNVSIFSPREQPYLKAQLVNELFLSSPPEDRNTKRIRKFVAFVKRNKEKTRTSNAWPQSKRRNKIFPVSHLILATSPAHSGCFIPSHNNKPNYKHIRYDMLHILTSLRLSQAPADLLQACSPRHSLF
jgi:hypothetical protein